MLILHCDSDFHPVQWHRHCMSRARRTSLLVCFLLLLCSWLSPAFSLDSLSSDVQQLLSGLILHWPEQLTGQGPFTDSLSGWILNPIGREPVLMPHRVHHEHLDPHKDLLSLHWHPAGLVLALKCQKYMCSKQPWLPMPLFV